MRPLPRSLMEYADRTLDRRSRSKRPGKNRLIRSWSDLSCHHVVIASAIGGGMLTRRCVRDSPVTGQPSRRPQRGSERHGPAKPKRSGCSCSPRPRQLHFGSAALADAATNSLSDLCAARRREAPPAPHGSVKCADNDLRAC